MTKSKTLLLAVSLSLPACRIYKKGNLAHYAGDGGVVIEKKASSKNHEICVAPPAQAAMALEIEAQRRRKASIPEGPSVEQEDALAYGETIAKLHEEGEKTLFLQFALYRLCEARFNGAFGDADDGPSDCEPEFRLAEKSLEFTSGVKGTLKEAEQAAAKAWSEARKANAAALEASAKRDAAQAKVKEAETALEEAKGKEERETRKKQLDSAKATAAEEQTAAATAAAAAKPLVEAANLAERKAAVLRSGLGTALQIANDDRDAHRRCRSSIGRDVYERKYSHVLEAAVDLWEQEAATAKATAEIEKHKATQETAKAKVEELKAKANDAAKTLEELKKSAVETLVKTTTKDANGK